METVYAATLVAGLVGLVMGSFAGATVWRLRARQLSEDSKELMRLTALKKASTALTADEAETLQYLQASNKERTSELKRLSGLVGGKVSHDRSRCLSCGHTLGMRDLVPLVSWLSTQGKCRYCHAPIGRFEPAIEAATAVAFAFFTYAWVASVGLSPIGLLLLVLWLVALTMLAILFAYDSKWFLLPDRVVFPLIGLSALIAALSLAMSGGFIVPALWSLAGSVAVLSGVYYVLWVVSRGRWVGFGDVKLNIALGLLLMDWKLALLTLFLANLIGSLVVLPGLLTKRLSRQTQVPFGPFLIVGFFIALVFGNALIKGYIDFSVWLSSRLLML